MFDFFGQFEFFLIFLSVSHNYISKKREKMQLASYFMHSGVLVYAQNVRNYIELVKKNSKFTFPFKLNGKAIAITDPLKKHIEHVCFMIIFPLSRSFLLDRFINYKILNSTPIYRWDVNIQIYFKRLEK